MINITTNITQVSANLARKIAAISSQPSMDALSREIAFTMVGEMRTRIHEKGLNSAGTQIGTYSPEYQRTRTNKYNRNDGSKVVFSLTRQMENDMTAGPIKTTKGYGIGFKNSHNFDKSQWLQDGIRPHNVKQHIRHIRGKAYEVTSYFNKGWRGFGRVYDPTENEKANARKIAEDFINHKIGTI